MGVGEGGLELPFIAVMVILKGAGLMHGRLHKCGTDCLTSCIRTETESGRPFVSVTEAFAPPATPQWCMVAAAREHCELTGTGGGGGPGGVRAAAAGRPVATRY